MSDKYFLDTNIIIYSFDSGEKEKQNISKELIASGLKNSHTSISYQVIQEFVNVATRKFDQPLSYNDCKFYVDHVLRLMWEVYPSQNLFHEAISIAEKWKYSFYDSLIIASALEASCNILYSEDLQHKQKIYSLKIVNPFLT